MELPNSWVVVKLGDFVKSEKGKKPQSESKTESETYTLPYIDIQAFEERIIKSWTDGVGCRLCYETDFLMVWDGSRSGLVGKGVNGALGSTLVRINFPSIINNYAFYFLQSKYQQINTRAKGVGIPHVDPALLWNYDFPIAPLPEQHRIVAKIEALFSELDKGVESLKTAREQLKTYRQALLKHAFSGKLTEQWRAENPDKLETAEALLQRIQTEREQRYRQQLNDWEATGKQGTKPKAPKTLPPLTAEELAELPELPEGWAWVKLADISDVSGGLTKNSKRSDLSIKRPFLRVGNVYANKLLLDDMHLIGISESEIERVELIKNDILIVEGNGSADQIGRAAIWNGAVEGCVHQNHLIKARPLKSVTSEFILYFLMSEVGRKFITRVASSTSGLYTLNISKVESLFIPFCNLGEQNFLIAELEEKISLCDQLDQTLTAALKQAETLRQAILKKAFSGQLVAQDPNDEPASELLKRIQAEKAALIPLSKKGKNHA
jgi:type I restriction enzyme, S subunit